jgi:large subunit ribosomal protein L3
MTEAWMKKRPKDLGRLLSVPEDYNTDAKMKEVEESLEKATDLRIVLCTQPRLAAVSQNKPEIMEVKVDGGIIKDRFEYAKKILGKQVSISDVFRGGQFVDVAAVTKGKGIQGVVKRWGVKRKSHKSRKSVRQIGTLGAWTPHYVMYSVPRAGQMGFHHRTEKNKRILRIGSKGEGASPEGGFPHYGVVRTDFLLLSGSVPGPAKRLMKLRYTTRPPTHVAETAPQINFVGLKTGG